MFRMMKRGSKGFTLVELMVVMSILAVLSAIVVPAVTGTKTIGNSTQLKSDLQNVQTAVNKYTTDSTTEASPETAFSDSTVGGWGLTSAEIAALTNMTNDLTIEGGTTAGKYVAIKFDATTSVKTSTGTTLTLKLVPDYLNVKPVSAETMPATGTRDFLWLMMIGTSTDMPNRIVELYKMGTSKYAKVS